MTSRPGTSGRDASLGRTPAITSESTTKKEQPTGNTQGNPPEEDAGTSGKENSAIDESPTRIEEPEKELTPAEKRKRFEYKALSSPLLYYIYPNIRPNQRDHPATNTNPNPDTNTNPE